METYRRTIKNKRIRRTRIKDKKYPSNENEVLIFNNLDKHSGIVQTDTQTRIVLNIATE